VCIFFQSSQAAECSILFSSLRFSFFLGFLKGTAEMCVGGNKNALNRTIGADGKREWSYGLFDCSKACGLCTYQPMPPTRPILTLFCFLVVCWAALCPCVVYGKSKQRLRSLRSQGAALSGGGERYNDDCFIYGLLNIPGYGWALQVCWVMTRCKLGSVSSTV
jgi:hypothetical protein